MASCPKQLLHANFIRNSFGQQHRAGGWRVDTVPPPILNHWNASKLPTISEPQAVCDTISAVGSSSHAQQLQLLLSHDGACAASNAHFAKQTTYQPPNLCKTNTQKHAISGGAHIIVTGAVKGAATTTITTTTILILRFILRLALPHPTTPTHTEPPRPPKPPLCCPVATPTLLRPHPGPQLLNHTHHIAVTRSPPPAGPTRPACAAQALTLYGSPAVKQMASQPLSVCVVHKTGARIPTNTLYQACWTTHAIRMMLMTTHHLSLNSSAAQAEVMTSPSML